MKHTYPSVLSEQIIRLAVLIALLIAYLSSGCEVFKTFNRDKNDTASVKKSVVSVDDINESSAVRTRENQSHEDNEWFRLTMKYLAENKSGDTTINHFITQPATVIYEGGRGSRDEKNKLVDSSWYQNIMKMVAGSTDSMSRKIDHYEKTKHSEGIGSGWITLLIIGLVLLVLNKALGSIANNYTITRKLAP